jgi:nucleoid-associated protein YgaU
MTSDAKIGLLLGLVFIFVIAFIINGLPNLRPQAGKAEVTTNMVSLEDEGFGVADKEQKARETITWNELLDQQADSSVVSEPGIQDAELPDEEPGEPIAENASGEQIRSILPLPRADTLERFTRSLEDVVKSLAEASAPSAAQEETTTTEPAPAIEAVSDRLRRERASAEQGTRPAAPSPGVRVAVGRTCVVVDGDTLASVAKKMYGLEQGNRIINIQRIYEANRNILKSPHEVRVGQELVIPPLERRESAGTRPETVLPKTLFDRVEAIGRRQLANAEKQDEPKRQPPGRWYVVADGDNLWRIASAQLGSGPRYEEIAKLNAHILKDKELLTVGMKLRLPAQ